MPVGYSTNKKRRILQQFNYRCHYCGCELVFLPDLLAQKSVRILRCSQNQNKPVIYETVGPDGVRRVHEKQRATLDHVKARRDGGNHGYKNLVASCFPCNAKRAAVAPKVWRQCKQCGKDKEPSTLKLCPHCERRNRDLQRYYHDARYEGISLTEEQAELYEANGWEETT